MENENIESSAHSESLISLENFREEFRVFLQEEIIGKYSEITKSRKVLKNLWLEAGKRGFFRGSINKVFGGYEDTRYSNILLEELGKAHLLDFPFWLQGSVMGGFFQNYGTDMQKEIYLTDLMYGKRLGAIAMTEDQSGSDISAFTTNAVSTEDGYVLTGKKKYIGCGFIADFYLVASRIDNSENIALFIVNSETIGVKAKCLISSSSLKGLDLGEIEFNDVVLSKDSLLGNRKNASIALLKTLAVERYSVSLIGNYICKSIIKIGSEWAKNRIVNSSSIYDNQYINFQFAEFYSNIILQESFMRDLSKTYEAKKQLALKDVAIAKYKVINELIQLTTFLSRLFGAKSIINETPIDIIKLQNDAIAQSLAGGTEEIMKTIIAKSL